MIWNFQIEEKQQQEQEGYVVERNTAFAYLGC